MTRLHERILDAWAAGISPSAIAERTGVSRSTITRVVQGARSRGDRRAECGPAQGEVEAIRTLWRSGEFDTARIAQLLHLPESLVSRIVAEGESAAQPVEAAPPAPEPEPGPVAARLTDPSEEAVLDLWAQGLGQVQITERTGVRGDRVRAIVSSAPEEAALSRAAAEAAALDAEILAALEAERRPRGTAWGYPEIPTARLAEPPPVIRGPVDVTARFFGDPPAGRSALDMRGVGA